MKTCDSRIKKFVLRILLVLISPVLFFALLEGALRLSSSRPTSFFERFEAAGRQWSMENLNFGQRFFRRYFPRAPAWSLFPEPSPDVPRIAIIGESAARGFPLEKLGLASMLQGVLETSYQGRRIDMINACMTAVNSHVLEKVAPEVAAQRPDVTVIYMGNNEVVGPYGPGTPFVSWTGLPGLVWLDKKIRGTKSFALIDDVIGQLVSKPLEKWEGFQMFEDFQVAADDPSLHSVYASFEANLDSMVADLLSAGGKVILCTIAVNLADWGPSGSDPLPEGSEAAILLQGSLELLQQHQPSEAAPLLEKAASLEPQNARICFWLGRALLAQGEFQAARAAFSKARDLDRHRFRADSLINDVIRRVAQRYAPRGVVLVDADRLLAENGLTSRKQFIEHVHFTFEGMLDLSLLIADRLATMFPQWGRPALFTQEDIPELRTRLFYTPFDEVMIAGYACKIGEAEIFASRPAAEEVNRHFSSIERQTREKNALDATQLQKAYDASVALRPDDARRDASCAYYLWQLKQYGPATSLGQSVLSRKPNHFEALLMAGEVALQSGDPDSAENFFHRALSIHHGLAEAWKGLGDVAAQRGDRRRARSSYERAWHMDRSQTGAALSLASLLIAEEDGESARRMLQEVRQANPDSAEVEIALARWYSDAGDKIAARQAFERALLLNPDLSPAFYLEFMSSHFPGLEEKRAFESWEERISLSPQLLNNFAWLLATSSDERVRDHEKALRLARRAVELSVNEPSAYYLGTLAAAEAALGNYDVARNILRGARERANGNEQFDSMADRMEAVFRQDKPFLGD
jgi:tetratricopeptide (TPR) repeat protein